jgi:hypothetical protein
MRPKHRTRQQPYVLAEKLLLTLQLWRQMTEFPAESDWTFASPVKIGPLTIFLHWGMAAAKSGGEKVRDRLDRNPHLPSHLSWLDELFPDRTRGSEAGHAARTTNGVIRNTLYYFDLSSNVTSVVYPTSRIINYSYRIGDF